MKNRIKRLTAALLSAAVFALSGCAMTVEQMYQVPRRSERYEDLQEAIDEVMGDMEYSAPTSGDNQQIVQMADLDGDGSSEVIVFARGAEADPMKILLFTPEGDGYSYLTAIESPGSGFDQVEYVQMDGKPGMELIVGRQVSDQVLRNVSVYSFADGQNVQLLAANYVKFLTCDLDTDGLEDLFLIRPGHENDDRAIAELYSMPQGNVERSAEEELSGPAERLKRIVTGRLESGEPAVYVASAAGEESIITDVFAMVNKTLTNVSFSNESGTSVKTLRNYYVYADDIDSDGVVELPDLITMEFPAEQTGTAGEHLIRWYAMSADGQEVDKMYTYHNFLEGWYVELADSLASRCCVMKDASGGYQFLLWDESKTQTDLLFTIYVLTGEDRLAVAEQADLTQLLKTDNVVYAVRLESGAVGYGLTADNLSNCFRLIQMDWNTGEM